MKLDCDPWTLGGVDDMIRADQAFGLFVECRNPACEKKGVRVRLSLYDLIRRFGRAHKKADVLATCRLCKHHRRDRTHTIISVGIKKPGWERVLPYCS